MSIRYLDNLRKSECTFILCRYNTYGSGVKLFHLDNTMCLWEPKGANRQLDLYLGIFGLMSVILDEGRLHQRHLATGHGNLCRLPQHPLSPQPFYLFRVILRRFYAHFKSRWW